MTTENERYQARITESSYGSFYALIVYVHNDGEERVIHGYEGRFFKTRANAEKSTARHINRFCKRAV